MLKVFNITTNIIIGCLVLSTVLHVALLLFTENNAYQQWVIAQIIIQIAAVVSLLYVRRFKAVSLAVFAVLSMMFTYISAFYVNYGDYTVQLVLFLLFWVAYGRLVFQVRVSFRCNVVNE